ncbi:MAG: iron-sulfur cluster assembly protein [Candidatus Neomarinimicrobiota bacterium]|jgi:metal-sulfur cluster biosynthetic enzyme|nr:iron-sulfur cluster assembly protein [Candidatus Neomarinimicrobiota bacterium]MEC7901563.1 iron-sulfur cluster assembly protein [Candidatus Neomarinimicrobiota bacterium]|tara:strand:+ start:403 stop:777 length:375 start_codon:yes stop_codon:yes gene_type:complete
MSQIKEAKVIEILKQCYDPELPVDLWNLGLIYNIQIQEAYDETKSDINIVMSLTTPGCTMGDQIAQDIRNKLEALTEVNQAFVEVTFDPPWNPEMITEEAKKKLGLGITKPENHDHITINEEWE